MDTLASLRPLVAMSTPESLPTPSDPSKTPSTRPRWLMPLAGMALAAAAWTGLIGHWLPGWAQPQVESAATEALGTPVRIGQIRIKPWTLEVGVDALSVGPPSAPWLTLAQVDAQISLESVWRMAPVIRQVTLKQPMFWLERQGAEQFNISAVMDRLRKAGHPPAEDDSPARFAVFNIAVHDGKIRYTDQVLKQTHLVDQIELGVPFVANLPSFIDAKVQPQLKARIDGSPLSVQGHTLPFKEGLNSEMHLDWRAVDLGHWLQAAQPFIPPSYKIESSQGQLDTALSLRFEQRKPPAVPALIIQGKLRLSEVGLRLPHAPGLGELDTRWTTLDVSGLDLQPLAHQAVVERIALEGLIVKARPTSGAALPIASPPPAAQSGQTPAADSKQAPPWHWSVKKLHLAARSIDLQTTREAPWPTLNRLVLDAQQLTGEAQAAPGTWRLAIGAADGTDLLMDGQAQLAQRSVQARLALNKATLPAWLAPVRQALNLPMQVQQGELSVQAQVSAKLQSPEGIHLSEGVVQIAKLHSKASNKTSKDQVTLAAMQLDGIDLQMPLVNGQPALKGVQLGELKLDLLDARLTRDAQGQWLGMAMPKDDKPGTLKSGTSAPASLPSMALKRLHCQSCKVQVTDQGTTPSAVLTLAQTDLTVLGASTDFGRALNVKLATRAQGNGRLSFEGEVRPQPLQLKAKVGVSDLDLRVLQPYLEPKVNIALASAKAQVDGRLQVQDDARTGLSARYQGRLGLSDLRVQDRVNDADLLSWRQLKLEGSDLGWSQGAVNADLGKISLQDFYGRIIINPDGKLNLAQIARHPDDTAPQSLTTPQEAGAKPVAAPVPAPAPAASAASGAATSSSPSPAMNLRWQGITLAKGKVDFTDNFIKPNYSARLTRVEGTISGVASNKPEPATVSIAGAVDDAAPLEISGQLHPLGPQLYTDIKASAKGVELTRLSAYSSRYAGYAIDKGTLSMNVHYKVDGGKLAAENQIFLDQLTFGDKTDSPDAVSLPVKLAVALLKNAKGEIDINLPISGSLSDPQFSVGGIIWKVIVNLITKALTAPFALLSGGGGGDELGFVPFPAGSALLDEAARKRLDTLSAKLKDRPALKLEATGRADPAQDVEGLRDAHVMKLMVAAKAKALDASPEDVSIAPEEKDQWLAAAYKAADIKKPRNLVGIAKTLTPAEMTALLKAAAPTGPEALKALANQRGNAVKAFLSEKLPADRVLLTSSKVGLEGLPEDKGSSTRVQFNIK
jgi:Domain of Unknown Function (DUF748)